VTVESGQHLAAVEGAHIDRSVLLLLLLLFWKVVVAVVVQIHMKSVLVLPQRRVWREDMEPVVVMKCCRIDFLNSPERLGRWGRQCVPGLAASW
jgi:hypothetical protein